MSAHRWCLDPVPSSAAQVRGLLRGLNLDHHTTKRSELLVTELVANALRHGGLSERDQIEVAVQDIAGGGLHVEVVDPGNGFDPHDARDASDGWGLQLLERLSDKWGVRRAEDRTCVWFDLAV